MLISRVLEDCGGRVEGEVSQENHSHEYQTANELFDIMAKTQNFQPTDKEALTTRDLVILYKNIDLGTKLMSSANEFKRKTPNQYVETVVYNDDHDSDSDLSEIYSSEDLHNVVMINKERIDLLTNPSTPENSLCQKIGNLEIKSSDFATDCDRRFLFKDPYIKEQLKTLNLVSGSKDFGGTVLPASLLDYICCKRLEDNYNFYMENIIRYVQQTIEQLRRISNGDYLTEKAKEKWREVDHYDPKDDNVDKKVLAMSTSIPLHVERKVTGLATTWDDIVHSEVDVRHLSKILEKKICYEVPKMIRGSYRLFSKCCADNVVISCKKDDASIPAVEKNKESRVDVVFKLARSESGHVMSNIDSILIFQKSLIDQENLVIKNNPLPLPYTDSDVEHRNPPNTEENPGSTSIVIKEYGFSDYPCSESSSNKNEESADKSNMCKTGFYVVSSDLSRKAVCESSDTSRIVESIDGFDITNYLETLEEPKIEVCNDSSGTSKNEGLHKLDAEKEEQIEAKNENLESDMSRKAIYQVSSDDFLNTFSPDSTDASSFNDKRKRPEAPFNIIPPDELHITMQRLNMPGPVPEESVDMDDHSGSLKRKSPTRIRIKSPYENKSYLLEEKKRKRLLEIRERREKKKIAMSENCKVTKNKFGKATITPQPSSSVTKLSITNKSFYDSIYGHANNIPVDGKQKGKRKDKNPGNSKAASEQDDDDDTSGAASVHKQKYINRSYYLDDTVTEMMYMQMKQKEGGTEYSESTSIGSTEFSSNMKLLTQLMEPVSTTNFESKRSSSTHDKLVEKLQEYQTNDNNNNINGETFPDTVIVPANTPNQTDALKKTATTVEFRKSIDKIYDLMHKLGKADGCENKPAKSKFTAAGTIVTSEKLNAYAARDHSIIQCSDSGTSIKHRIESSTTSYISFDKGNNGDISSSTRLKISDNSAELVAPVVPKVIISAKPQPCKADGEKKSNKRPPFSPKTCHDNPLKAISQLLHEFDTVQKTRHKANAETKGSKKTDTSPDRKPTRQISNKRHLRFETNNDNEAPFERIPRTKDRRPRQSHAAIERQKSHPQPSLKRQVIDIVEEFKEARGEAVRGPSKLTSRIQSLAQPKKTYVQAHMEEYQTKYGRNMMSDRLQKLAAPSPTIGDKRSGSARQRARKAGGTEAMSTVKQTISTSERVAKARQSTTCNPEVMAMLPSVNETSSYKQNNVVEKPDNLKKKMVAVESYVKNHYGRVTLPVDTKQSLLRPRDAGREIVSTESGPLLLKSRVPFVPNDLELSSLTSSPILEESTIIGRRLHHIIDTMINSPVATLTAVEESSEDMVKPSKDSNSAKKRSHSANKTTDTNQISNANDEIECDELKTRVSQRALNTKKKKPEETYVKKYETRSLNSNMEIEQLENALSNRLSVGTFHKRLRIKNLTLTPKHSTQQVLLLHSGDVGSLVLKSTTSQKIVMNQTKSDTVANLKTLSRMPDKNATFGNFPVQIATVGYMFPVQKKKINNIFKSDFFFDDFNGSSSTQKINSKIEDCINIGSEDFIKQHEKSIAKEPKSLSNIKIENALKQHNCCIIVSDNADSRKSIHDTVLQEVENTIDTKGSKNVSLCATQPEKIDYSTSLDLLVGLLNEIQNITTCQTEIATSVQNSCNDEGCKQIACITEHTVEEYPYKPKDMLSFTCLDRLRQLDSSPSIYSLYLSHEDDTLHEQAQEVDVKSEVVNVHPIEITTAIYADKEINVDIPEKEVINKCTEVPSQLIALTKNGSTYVSESLCGILSQPSAHSVITVVESDAEVKIDGTDSRSALKTIVELQNISTAKNNDSELKSGSLSMVVPSKDNKLQIYDSKINKNGYSNVHQIAPICKKIVSEKLLIAAKHDPVMKIKRDVLVTVYSILMFTVFAALSFPELMYRS